MVWFRHPTYGKFLESVFSTTSAKRAACLIESLVRCLPYHVCASMPLLSSALLLWGSKPLPCFRKPMLSLNSERQLHSPVGRGAPKHDSNQFLSEVG